MKIFSQSDEICRLLVEGSKIGNARQMDATCALKQLQFGK